MKLVLTALVLLVSLVTEAQPVTRSVETDAKPRLPACKGVNIQKWSDCEGTYTYPNGNIYWGEFKNSQRHGLGKIRILAKGKSDALSIRSEVPATYVGQFRNNKISGFGVWSLDSGERFEGEFLDNIYKGPKLEPKEKAPKISGASGSGFFVSKDGLFVTNWHVVEHAKSIAVIGFDKQKREATIVGKDFINDLVVLKVNGDSDYWLRISTDSGLVKRGTEVITVGYPRVFLQGFEPKVTSGIVSSLSGVIDDPRVFQITVPIQPGNSGGALVAHDGNVVGVVTAKLSSESVKGTPGGAPENVNYAIKSNYLLELLKSHAVKAQLSSKKIEKFNSLAELTEVVEKSSGVVLAIE